MRLRIALIFLTFALNHTSALSWNGNWAVGCRFSGNDLTSVSSVEAEECRAQCARVKDCSHFTWTNDSLCWMKSGSVAKDDAISMTDGSVCGIISILWNQNSIAMDCIFIGNDLSHFQLQASECSLYCQNTTKCTHFSWTNGTCWLQSGRVTKHQARWKPDSICGIILAAEEDGRFLWIFLAVVVCPIVALIIIIVVVGFSCCYYCSRRLLKNRRPKEVDVILKNYRMDKEKHEAEARLVENELLPSPAYTLPQFQIFNDIVKDLPFGNFTRDLREISDHVSVVETIGTGVFRVTKKAELSELRKPTAKFVAIKRAQNDQDKLQNALIESEIKLLAYVGSHPNIVGLIGFIASDQGPSLVLEYCDCGSLKQCLDKKRLQVHPNTGTGQREWPNMIDLPRLLVFLAQQVSAGMEFLHSKKCVNRDLAARNILLSNYETVAKLSDFGLAKDIYSYDYFKVNVNKTVPWAWSAPETLNYSIHFFKSDVWSFGILLWEMMSLGEQPYAGTNLSTAFLKELEHGRRLENPQLADDKICQLMGKCWKWNPRNRPNFSKINEQLKTLLDSYLVQ